MIKDRQTRHGDPSNNRDYFVQYRYLINKQKNKYLRMIALKRRNGTLTMKIKEWPRTSYSKATWLEEG